MYHSSVSQGEKQLNLFSLISVDMQPKMFSPYFK